MLQALAYREQVCHKQGSILEKNHSHTFVAFHSARVIRGDLPKKPTEAHTGYTQRAGAYVIEVRRDNVGGKVMVTGCVCRWSGGVGLKPGSCSGSTCAVERKSTGLCMRPLVQPGSRVGWSELWLLTVHKGWRSHSHWCPDGVLTSLSKCPDLWFWEFRPLPRAFS